MCVRRAGVVITSAFFIAFGVMCVVLRTPRHSLRPLALRCHLLSTFGAVRQLLVPLALTSLVIGKMLNWGTVELLN